MAGKKTKSPKKKGKQPMVSRFITYNSWWGDDNYHIHYFYKSCARVTVINTKICSPKKIDFFVRYVSPAMATCVNVAMQISLELWNGFIIHFHFVLVMGQPYNTMICLIFVFYYWIMAWNAYPNRFTNVEINCLKISFFVIIIIIIHSISNHTIKRTRVEIQIALHTFWIPERCC